MEPSINEQQRLRRESLSELRSLGIDPFPAELFPINTTAQDILSNFESNPDNYKEVVIAGRLMARRIMGKAAFAVIQDSSAKIQIYVNRDEICTEEDKTLYNTVFKKLLDIGDIIGVKGYVF